jgi:hypothetical protein
VTARIYGMISNNGLVAMRKINGGTYVKITEKGDDISNKLLQELIAYGEIVNMNKEIIVNPDPSVMAYQVGPDPGLLAMQKRYLYLLAEKISYINLPFEDELKTIEED